VRPCRFSFLSTTLDRDVALNYAAGAAGEGKPGVLFEIQQGLVDRGASLTWLSQYPHEQEICFGPLTGLEVHDASVDGSVLVLSMRLNVNLQALTIEQVVSKRRKLCADMCSNMEAELSHEVRGQGWEVLRSLVPAAPARAMRSLEAQLNSFSTQPPEYYNDDQKLGAAIKGAVDAKSFVTKWPKSLLDGFTPLHRSNTGDRTLLRQVRYTPAPARSRFVCRDAQPFAARCCRGPKAKLTSGDISLWQCLLEKDTIVKTGGNNVATLVESSTGLDPVLAQLSLALSLRELHLGGNLLTVRSTRRLERSTRLHPRHTLRAHTCRPPLCRQDEHLARICLALELNEQVRIVILTLDRNLITDISPLVKLLSGPSSATGRASTVARASTGPSNLGNLHGLGVSRASIAVRASIRIGASRASTGVGNGAGGGALSSLRRLDVSCNKLTSKSLRLLADALPTATSLRRINVLQQKSSMGLDDARYLIARAEECIAGAKAALAAHPAESAFEEAPVVGAKPLSWHAPGVPKYTDRHAAGAITLCGSELERYQRTALSAEEERGEEDGEEEAQPAREAEAPAKAATHVILDPAPVPTPKETDAPARSETPAQPQITRIEQRKIGVNSVRTVAFQPMPSSNAAFYFDGEDDHNEQSWQVCLTRSLKKWGEAVL
jgi:hypothetical protein